ncbi:MAG: UDP-glucose 4-epimerase [Rhodocyclaceae bacterium]|nr:UDP-glucose 4-epimerase GalE [Zoogloeaceae bacterium]MBV6406939.1 UDP-glucose 4-epimerase [Rhodocyclaceae bacterium]
MASILVTGGAGYIGSHTVVELLAAGHEVTVLDNFCNSSPVALGRVARIAGRAPHCVRADLRDAAALEGLFAARPFDAVIHFAGLKAVGESVAEPLRYYDNNVAGTLRLCEAMARHAVKTIVFSSSATVYGDPAAVPIREDAATAPTNPYGRSKLMVEDMLRDLAASDSGWRVALLRYFNPVGAHASGLIGEDPQGVPNNLMPFVSQVAVGRRAELSVWGNDYPTPDGTGVRDYIHVVDLARGHLAALDRMPAAGVATVNLGTGRGYSVLEMVHAFERASGCPVPYRIAARRPGDVAACYADPSLAERLLGWRAQRDLAAMCADTWRWQRMNPQGYPAQD